MACCKYLVQVCVLTLYQCGSICRQCALHGLLPNRVARDSSQLRLARLRIAKEHTETAGRRWYGHRLGAECSTMVQETSIMFFAQGRSLLWTIPYSLGFGCVNHKCVSPHCSPPPARTLPLPLTLPNYHSRAYDAVPNGLVPDVSKATLTRETLAVKHLDPLLVVPVAGGVGLIVTSLQHDMKVVQRGGPTVTRQEQP